MKPFFRTRDGTRAPYTAGHERRVADIAERIGKELELPAEQLSGLRITGLIHDVGKIGVPSEIPRRR